MMYDLLIDLSKIDKSKIFTNKAGRKYLPLTMVERREPDQFGNEWTIYQKQSKEEREKNVDKVYCGRAKTITFNKEERANETDEQEYIPF